MKKLLFAFIFIFFIGRGEVSSLCLLTPKGEVNSVESNLTFAGPFRPGDYLGGGWAVLQSSINGTRTDYTWRYTWNASSWADNGISTFKIQIYGSNLISVKINDTVWKFYNNNGQMTIYYQSRVDFVVEIESQGTSGQPSVWFSYDA